MKNLATMIGLALIALGAVGYFGWEMIGADKKSLTALIPSGFGLLILVGALMGGKGLRLSAVGGILGVLAGLGRLIPSAMKEGFDPAAPSTILIAAMTVLCLIVAVPGLKQFKS